MEGSLTSNGVTEHGTSNGSNGDMQIEEICNAQVAGSIEGDNDAGRYLVAGKHLKSGEVVLSEYPIVAGPLYTRSKPVCLQCLKKLSAETVVNCPLCGAPLCGDAACLEGGRWHAMECSVLQAAGYQISIQNWDADCPIYSCITVLRGLLLQQKDAGAWKILNSFMDHDQVRFVAGSQFTTRIYLFPVEIFRKALQNNPVRKVFIICIGPQCEGLSHVADP